MQCLDLQNDSLPLNSAVLYDTQQQQWLYFHSPAKILVAREMAEVLPLLKTLQQETLQQGYYAVGWISYEAAPAFDSSFRVRADSEFPLAWFGLYPAPQSIQLPLISSFVPHHPSLELPWMPSISRQEYDAAIAQIKHCIARGDTYQVNFSFRLRSPFSLNPWHYFLQLMAAQESLYGAFLNLEEWAICCASPELFFQQRDRTILSRPMKGTAPRGLTSEGDRQIALELQRSEKNRAENLMIVDMIRNDLGRIAETGSVQVTQLFETERYPTLWQMTSTVQAETKAPFSDVMRSLFPCASITGAPKASTMAIIAELEDSPRRIYTGTIGFLAPDQSAQFNVAIRTVLIDKARQQAEYGVGGGIVWDSLATSEYEECCTKARVLTRQMPDFELLESLLWTPQAGYFLLDLHLKRLKHSAEYFAFPLSEAEVRDRLHQFAQPLSSQPYKIRLRVAKSGTLELEAHPLKLTKMQPLKVAIAASPIDPNNLFLYHKTTHRKIYEQAKQQHPGADDVLLWNPRGELTESCFANLVVEQDGHWFTPPVPCGLLAGTFREWLLSQQKITEKVLFVEEIASFDRIFLVNSVRQWQETSWQSFGAVAPKLCQLPRP